MDAVSPLHRQFLRLWFATAATGGALMSVADAALLQQTRSFFTGGFLASDYLRGPSAMAAFALVSWVCDTALVGITAAAVMWLLFRQELRVRAIVAAGFIAGVGPLVTADIISAQLLRYVGDAIDLSLMFDLTGGSVKELLAVASAHVVTPLILITVSSCMAVGCVWLVNRFGGGSASGRVPLSSLRMPLVLLAIAVAAVSVAAATSDSLENGLVRKPSGRVVSSIVDVATDLDRDGFGLGGRIPDPAPFSRSIFPYAVDVPGDGIDEDGIGGDLPGNVVPYVEPSRSTPWLRHPDVVLIVLESFRADLLQSRDRGKAVTPAIDALAARGVSSARAFSHNGYTAQSRFHIFSGSLAGVRDGRTLIDDFKTNGYTTAYFSGQDESFGGPEYSSGFERADVHYDARDDRDRRYSGFSTPGSLAVPFTLVNEHVTDFLKSYGARQQPLFVYINYEDTHFPYWHPGVQPLTSATYVARAQIAPERAVELRSMYANTAANVDRAIGDILETVRRTRGTDPAVIITADHGESLYEDGFLGHGYALNDVQTHIPLVVANLPIVIREPFGQSDLRDAVGDALRTPPDSPTTPTIAASDRDVFQYLGTLGRPREIAVLRANGGRTIYDFRNGRAQVKAGTWQRFSDVGPGEQPALLRVIQYWERMIVARHARASE
jgi:hypothetical protein